MGEPREVYTVEDLRQAEATFRDLAPTPRYAVIGDPVAHSASPALHNAAFQALGLDEQYIRVLVHNEELGEAIHLLAGAGFHGVNVTIPHKASVGAFLDEVGDAAQRIGAVNTILFEDGRTFGFNSDAPGFRQAIRDEFAVDLSDLRVLILGAGGGAGRAAAIQCGEDRCERLVLVNRTVSKMDDLVEMLEGPLTRGRFLGPVSRFEAIPWEETPVAQALKHIDLIVNATNIGMRRSDPRLLPAALIQPHHLLYDMVYRPARTRFLEDGIHEGARVANGLSMLLWQGVISLEYWLNRDAPVEAMRKALEEAVA